MTPKTTYEPFVGAFSGMLKTFTASDGKRYRLDGKGVRIEKDQHYMIKIGDGRVTFLPVHIPMGVWP